MYSEKFATAVKVAGKVLRENGETVALPFGSEYSIHLKNMNAVRALVKVEIDGVDATEGTQLIVPANGSIDLERFIKSGNMDEGLRFKFIERTKKIEDGPRGIGVEDGLIRVEFEFEQQQAALYHSYRPSVLLGNPWHYDSFWTKTYSTSDSAQYIAKAVVRGLSSNTIGATLASSGVASSGTAQAMNTSVSDVGITVGGSRSDQKFVAGSWFPTDGVKHVMILKLLGQIGERPVEKPITVKTKQECPTCGTMNKFGTKFCKECGTGLVLI